MEFVRRFVIFNIQSALLPTVAMFEVPLNTIRVQYVVLKRNSDSVIYISFPVPFS